MVAFQPATIPPEKVENIYIVPAEITEIKEDEVNILSYLNAGEINKIISVERNEDLIEGINKNIEIILEKYEEIISLRDSVITDLKNYIEDYNKVNKNDITEVANENINELENRNKRDLENSKNLKEILEGRQEINQDLNDFYDITFEIIRRLESTKQDLLEMHNNLKRRD